MSKLQSSSKKDWREWRRQQAWQLHEQGWRQKEIAQALGVTEGAVSQWFKKAKEQGPEALRHQPPPGPQRKLSAEQQAQLPRLLAQGAEAFGFRGDVWTTQRVALLIKRQFGVSSHPAHCSRLLRSLRHSQQKPIQKATQRDEEAIADWKDRCWPALKKKREWKSEPSSLSMRQVSRCCRWQCVPMLPKGKHPSCMCL